MIEKMELEKVDKSVWELCDYLFFTKGGLGTGRFVSDNAETRQEQSKQQ